MSTVVAYGQQASKAATSGQPNIIWITCEDTSPYIGAYGDKLVKTPNIDQLAKEGVRYTRAYTTAGVCAPSRAAIITGMYQQSIGAQHMRTTGDAKYQPVPLYSAVVPEQVKCFPEYLRKAGYYCTNNEKQDYQFVAPVTVWDENGPAASFRNRPRRGDDRRGDGKDKPFFAVFNFMITHESQLFSRKDSLLIQGSQVTVPPIYPDTKIVRQDIARMLTNIERMDSQVGELIQLLKADGLYDNTIIFFYSDHGGNIPWTKREVLERGTHIPFIIRFPGAANAGTVNNELISAVDFAPTVLSLAGVPIPAYMQGQAFLGKQKAKTPRQYVFAARDRMDSEYDRVRMVRDKRYRYLYNYMPEKPYYQNLRYRMSIPMMQELVKLRDEGKLDSTQMGWFKTKPVEELYDMDNDPYELHNLATDPKHAKKLIELRSVFQNWTNTVGDMATTPERDMIRQMWNGQDEAPTTATPQVTPAQGGVKLSCATNGASIGYRIVKAGADDKPAMHTVQSWDLIILTGGKSGGQKPADPVWDVYDGEVIPLGVGDTLHVNAMRIGYKASTLDYKGGQVLAGK
ncbi:sulfatase-like hydrolase/transferase [Spirosoma gilvum]